jgi:hypothetical protein
MLSTASALWSQAGDDGTVGTAVGVDGRQRNLRDSWQAHRRSGAENAAAASLAPFSVTEMAAVGAVYATGSAASCTRTGEVTGARHSPVNPAPKLRRGLKTPPYIGDGLLFAHNSVVARRQSVSLTVRALTHRTRFNFEPALSFVPDARAPPERLLADDRACGLVVDVEVAGGVAQRARACRTAARSRANTAP